MLARHSAQAKLESFFWKNESSFPFEKFLTCMNEASMEMEDAIRWLIRGIKNDDIQVQTTIGIIRDRYLDNFDGASLTQFRTMSSRFASIEPGTNKRSIGAVNSNSGRGSGRGRGRG
jgi:RimJ/RimL family protein N-acetyltransferase